MVTVCTDASVGARNSVGLGAHLRAPNGVVYDVAWPIRKHDAFEWAQTREQLILLAEWEAVLHGVALAWDQFPGGTVVVQTDCLTLVRMFRAARDSHPVPQEWECLAEFARTHRDVRLEHVPRGGNAVAHRKANEARLEVERRKAA